MIHIAPLPASVDRIAVRVQAAIDSPTFTAMGITMRELVADVAAKHGLDVEDILGYEKTREACLARDEAIWVCRKRTRYSFPRIARFFSNRDHTTAYYSFQRHEARLSQSRKAEGEG